MRRFKSIIILLGILLGFGCESESPTAYEEDILVIQAYLYANEPINDIRITKMLPLDVAEGIEIPVVNDANVQLIKNGQSYNLIASAGDSGYYHYPDANLTVNANDIFQIKIEYNDQIITAETTVPEATQNVSLTSSTLRIPTFDQIFYGEIDPELLETTVKWENDAGELFYVTIKNIESDPDSIENDFPRNFDRKINFPPTSRDEYRISYNQLPFYGTYIINVYHVNEEYARLYDTQEQDSRSLNEPYSNIENGLGIFSAFNSNPDSLFLEVVPY